jgi:hypothetical protein
LLRSSSNFQPDRVLYDCLAFRPTEEHCLDRVQPCKLSGRTPRTVIVPPVKGMPPNAKVFECVGHFEYPFYRDQKFRIDTLAYFTTRGLQ